MSNSRPVRAITFALFLTLVGGFVAYRVGAFENTSTAAIDLHSGEGAGIIALDTPRVDSQTQVIELNEEMMSSSKSMALPRPKKSEPQDSPKIQNKEMMTSSKSAVIFHSSDFKIDTTKKESDSKKEPELKPMMGGSKSLVLPVQKTKKDSTQKPKK